MPELPSTARGAATSRRILDAAIEEFSEYGIAGARIERIIAAAHTNKAQLYGYFGNKEALFDAVIADCVDQSTSSIPFDAYDLADWAVRIYDKNLSSPHLTRLIGWIRLERARPGRWFDTDEHEPKLHAVRQAQADGKVRAEDPIDLLTLVLGMASAWSPTSGLHTATADEPAADHERRRALLRDCVERVVVP